MQATMIEVEDLTDAQFYVMPFSPDTLNGNGEYEIRPPGDYGDFHTSPEGVEMIVAVIFGSWQLQLDSGAFKEFTCGDVVIIKDYGAIQGHCSRNGGATELCLSKVFVERIR